MLRIALSTLAARKGGTLGAFASVGLAVTLVVSCGILLQASLDAPIRVDRLDAAAVVVEADQAVQSPPAKATVTPLLAERRRVDAGLAARIARVPGVAQAIADRSLYAQVVDRRGRVVLGRDGEPSAGHGWASAALTPYAVTSGHRPHAASEVVLDAALATDAGLAPGDTVRIL